MSIFDIERLIKYGYFPKELPPCFSTNDLANQAALVLRATGCISPKNSIPLVYSGFKSEKSRRKYSNYASTTWTPGTFLPNSAMN